MTYRDATNTGYRPLRRVDGDVTITTPNTVIEGIDLHGALTIKAKYCTVRGSILRGGKPITSGSNGILSIVEGGADYLVSDVTLLPEFPNVRQDGIKVNQPGIFRSIDLSGTADGMTIYGDGVTVEDSYLHHFVTYASDPAHGGGPSHSDAIAVQAGRWVTVRRSTIQGANNAAIIVTQDAGPVGDLVVDDCDIDGGAVSINVVTKGNTISGMKVTNSRFGRGQRVVGGAIMANPRHALIGVAGSVWADTKQPIAVMRGA